MAQVKNDRPRTNEPGDDPSPGPDPVTADELGGRIGEHYKKLGGKKWGILLHLPRPFDGGQYASFGDPPHRFFTKAIFSSPRTGAHVMTGAIWPAWLNGPYKTLGHPTSGVMVTHDKKGRWQRFEHGDYIWHPDTGAHEVHGAIAELYHKLGGSSWGYPTTDESPTANGRGRFNHFRDPVSGAEKSIYWTPQTKAQPVMGYIGHAWAALSWERGVLGHPTSGEMSTHDNQGRFQSFEGGLIVWHPKTGAFEVHGDILARYLQLGGTRWGYPTSNEGKAVGSGRYSHFVHLPSGEGRSIYWSPSTGAVDVYGGIHARYKAMGFERSHLGYPASPEADWPAGGPGSRQQKFQGGSILWRAAEMAAVPDPVVLPYELPGGGAFDGRLTVRLHSSGKVHFSGEVENGGVDKYDYSVYALVRAGDLTLAVRRSGDINPKLGGNTNRWDESTHSDALRDNFFAFHGAKLEVHENHKGVITGAIDDILSTVLAWATTATLGPGVVGMIYAGIELGAVVTGGSWNAGPRIIAGSLWMMGPEGYLVGMAVDALASIGSQSRGLNPQERSFLRAIFGDKIDLDKVTLTDTKGKGGKKFVFPSPRPGTSVNMNMGNKYEKTPDFSTTSYPKLLAHEATHAWQYAHMSNPSSYILHGIFDTNYEPGSLGKDWSRYNIEQQATIVERWVEANYQPNQPDFGLSSKKALDDPAFRYIAGNVRVGRP